MFPEGFAMLKTMIEEFRKAGFETAAVLNEGASKFENWLEADSVFTDKELDEVLKLDIDAAMAIGPDAELVGITERMREKGITVLGPDSRSIELASDKWKTHIAAEGDIPQPKAWSNFNRSNRPNVEKPRFGVGSSGVSLAFEKPENSPSERIYEEYIRGKHVSSCILSNEKSSSVLSINEQNITIEGGSFEYRGGRIPYEGRKREKCAEIASEAVDILGISGVCGVDMVIDEGVYFIELNPRVTTSFVGLAPLLSDSLGKILVKALLQDQAPPNPGIEGRSIIKIPKVDKSTVLDRKGVEKIRGIPQIVSPPFTINNHLKENSPLFLVRGTGEKFDEIERVLDKKIRKAINLLGIERDVVSWT